MLFDRRKKTPDSLIPDTDVYTQSSICTGETIIGFKNKRGILERAVVVRSQKDIDDFYEQYHLKKSDDTKERVILKNSKNGFTLIELVCILTVIGILATVSVPAFSGYMAKSKEKQCKVNCDVLANTMVAQLNLERTMGTYGNPGTLSELYISAVGSAAGSGGTNTDYGNSADSSAFSFFVTALAADGEDFSHADEIVKWMTDNNLCDELICPSNGHHYRYNAADHVFTCGVHQSDGSNDNSMPKAAISGDEFSLSSGNGMYSPAPTGAPASDVTLPPVAAPTPTPAVPDMGELSTPIPLDQGGIQISYSPESGKDSSYYPFGHNSIAFMEDEAPATLNDLKRLITASIKWRNPETGEVLADQWMSEYLRPDQFSLSGSYSPQAGVYTVTMTVPRIEEGDGTSVWRYIEGSATLYVYVYSYHTLEYTVHDTATDTYAKIKIRVRPWEYYQIKSDDTNQGEGIVGNSVIVENGNYYFVPSNYSRIYGHWGPIDFSTFTVKSQTAYGWDGAVTDMSPNTVFTLNDTYSESWGYVWDKDIPKGSLGYFPTYNNDENKVFVSIASINKGTYWYQSYQWGELNPDDVSITY